MKFLTHPTQPLTSLYRQPALAIPKGGRQLLIFIPGNPGLIDYYTTYLELVQRKYPTLEILNISHAGFQTTGDFVKRGETSPFEFYDLEFQINHKVEIISEYLKEAKAGEEGEGDELEPIKVYILCHSVGSFVTQRVVKRLLSKPDVSRLFKLRFVGLICPTILDIKVSSSGVLFTRLFRVLPVIRLVLLFAKILKLILPLRWIKRLIRYKLATKSVTSGDPDATSNMENSIIATYNLFSSQRIIRQALTLAEEEMEEISQHDEINDFFFKQLTREPHDVKIWSFFANLDYWVHDNTRDSILEKYYDKNNRNILFELGEAGGITHSFCVDQNKQFANITCLALQRFFGPQL